LSRIFNEFNLFYVKNSLSAVLVYSPTKLKYVLIAHPAVCGCARYVCAICAFCSEYRVCGGAGAVGTTFALV